MKKTILLLLSVVSFGFTQAQSVCNPNPLYVLAGLPGLWPNPQQGPLPDGDINQPYSETITVLVPADTTIDLSQFGLPFGTATVSINLLEISGINGLPTGLNYACDQSGCTWGNSSNGCLKISGTPTQDGQFVIGILTSLNFDVPNFGPFQTPPAPANYDLFIASPTTTITDLRANGYSLESLAPNPTSGGCVLRFTTPVAATVQLQIHDITGHKVHDAEQFVTADEHSFQIDTEQWSPGIYLCSLLVNGKRITTKLIVE